MKTIKENLKELALKIRAQKLNIKQKQRNGQSITWKDYNDLISDRHIYRISHIAYTILKKTKGEITDLSADNLLDLIYNKFKIESEKGKESLYLLKVKEQIEFFKGEEK